ncbi:MAG: hypothetical protein A2289_22115 [Deltaproteobacteria bacterium RIFOXYA12_FULL_58_15]|nr:MAG: hypothetical protein A2289_22115 [Deltaproteobacteria bacterium RIFOXYA12_FULL_58_15]OGR12294.1 MAG: hypothetical protein A2341_20950 [Deltaproteobacteria bacterium RIFOXYB12_FULL_58_9]
MAKWRSWFKPNLVVLVFAGCGRVGYAPLTDDATTHGDAAHGDAAHGDAAYGDATHGDTAHGDAIYGDAPQLPDQTGDNSILCDTYWTDGDGDGLGAPGAHVTSCEPMDGYVTNDSDCDDSSTQCTTTCVDSDLDDIFDCEDPCLDADGDGYGIDGPAGTCLGPDCDDSSDQAHPGLAEGTGSTCTDGWDNDCDTLIDGDEPECFVVWIWNDYDVVTPNLLRSADGGVSFDEITVCNSIRQVTMTEDTQFTFVACADGLYLSSSNGDTGTFNRINNSAFTTMRVSRTGQYVIATTGDPGAGGDAYFSINHGQDWSQATLPANRAAWIWISRSGQYMTVADAELNSDLTFYYSVNFGAAWQSKALAVGNFEVGNAVCSEDGRYWMIDSIRRGVYTSDDSLTSTTQSYYDTSTSAWSYGYISENGRVAVAREGSSEAVVYTDYFATVKPLAGAWAPSRQDDPITPDGRVVGVRDQISRDYGATFRTETSCYMLDVSPDGAVVLCGGDGSGVFKLSTDEGQTFTTIRTQSGFMSGCLAGI